jgi:hypothetical protein
MSVNIMVLNWKLAYSLSIKNKHLMHEEYLGPLSGFWWFNDTHLSS